MAIDTLRLHPIRIIALVMEIGLPGFVLLGHSMATNRRKKRIERCNISVPPHAVKRNTTIPVKINVNSRQLGLVFMHHPRLDYACSGLKRSP